MLQVLTPEETLRLIDKSFSPVPDGAESVPLREALGRVLAEDIRAAEDVPGFTRSTVDGYAVRAADTFGCSEALPAVLWLAGEVEMGRAAPARLERDSCVSVPTGGAIPEGADCAVMIEYTENYGDGTVGLFKPGAPGMNLIFRGDDVRAGQTLLSAGRVLRAGDIGALAAVGRTEVPVRRKLRVGLISTGDELVEPEQTPGPGQVRDVNTPMLDALLRECGAEPVPFGIVRDDEARLREAVAAAARSCDAVLLSGGSSAGVKDAACRIIGELGEVLLHGIAIKPGKPTILGRIGGGPVVGLPGHPAAAYFIAMLFVRPLLDRLSGARRSVCAVSAELSESISADHGRAQVNACRLKTVDGKRIAVPIRSKSGLISRLAGADGYLIIDRDCEGLSRGAAVEVYLD